MPRFNACFLLGILLFLNRLAGQNIETPAPPPAAPPVSSAAASSDSPTQMDLLDDERPLLVGETVSYNVLEEREQATGLVVGSDKNIEIPLLGKVSVEGLTCRKAAYKIKELLEKEFFHHATVVLKHGYTESGRGTISVWGEIKNPGTASIPKDRVLTVVKAIMERGGFTENANKKAVVLRRLDPAKAGEVLPPSRLMPPPSKARGIFPKTLRSRTATSSPSLPSLPARPSTPSPGRSTAPA